MIKRFSASIAILLVTAISVFAFSGCNSCTGSVGDETTPSTQAVSATLMPGYVDDNTSAVSEDATKAEETTRVFTPSGPMKDGNYDGDFSQGGSKDNEVSDKPEEPLSTTAAGVQNTPSDKPQESTALSTQSTQKATEPQPTETTLSTEISETTKATDAVENTTASNVEPTEGESVAETSATEVSEPTEQETTTTPDNEYPVPGIPDSDVIGPKPPIDLDDFLNPDNTVPATQSTTSGVDYTSSATSADATDKATSVVTTPQITIVPDTPEETEATVKTEPAVTEATKATEATNPTDASGRLEFSYYGSFTGEFVEDGSDEYVQNVAIIFVTNISEKYLEYAVITFDIDGQVAAFTATGLAPGESVWVLEQNRLQVQKGAVFTYVDDMSSFTDYVLPSETGVDVILGDGQLRVKNNTGKDLTDVYVYYKQVHTDGNFLGGITYRVPIGDLKSGEEADSVAMHSRVGSSKVVSVTYREEAN